MLSVGRACGLHYEDYMRTKQPPHIQGKRVLSRPGVSDRVMGNDENGDLGAGGKEEPRTQLPFGSESSQGSSPSINTVDFKALCQQEFRPVKKQRVTKEHHQVIFTHLSTHAVQYLKNGVFDMKFAFTNHIEIHRLSNSGFFRKEHLSLVNFAKNVKLMCVSHSLNFLKSKCNVLESCYANKMLEESFFIICHNHQRDRELMRCVR